MRTDSCSYNSQINHYERHGSTYSLFIEFLVASYYRCPLTLGVLIVCVIHLEIGCRPGVYYAGTMSLVKQKIIYMTISDDRPGDGEGRHARKEGGSGTSATRQPSWTAGLSGAWLHRFRACARCGCRLERRREVAAYLGDARQACEHEGAEHRVYPFRGE